MGTVTEGGVVTVLLAEAALFVTALAVFGVLAVVLRTRAALRNRRGSAERRMHDEAAAARRVTRRLIELAPGREARTPRAQPALAAPTVSPLTVDASVPRRRQRGPVTLVATGILAVLLVGAGAAVSRSGAVPGGVLGLRGVPAASQPSHGVVGASRIHTGSAAVAFPSVASLPSRPATVGSEATLGNAVPSPVETPVLSTAHALSPSLGSAPPIANPGGTQLATTGPCGAASCAVYVVRSGDTLGRIARQFGVSIQAILAVNPQLRDPNLIVTGQTLLLPSTAR